MTPLRILVTGSRDWADANTVLTALTATATAHGAKHGLTIADWRHFTTVVHGACPTGADHFADVWAKCYGWKVERHPADWSQGRRAGPLRNAHMVSLGADVCAAFIRNDSRGASGCMALAMDAGIPIRLFREYAYTR